MPSYNTIPQDEKSSLLHPDMAGNPLIIEHYIDGSRCSCDLERGYKKRRAGCCLRMCRIFLWVAFAVAALIFFLRSTRRGFSLPSVSDKSRQIIQTDPNYVFSSGVSDLPAKSQSPSLIVQRPQFHTRQEN
jgi:hypothetical protein